MVIPQGKVREARDTAYHKATASYRSVLEKAKLAAREKSKQVASESALSHGVLPGGSGGGR